MREDLAKLLKVFDLKAALIYAGLLAGFYFAARAFLLPFAAVRRFLSDLYPIFVLMIFLPALLRRKRVAGLGFLGALLGLVTAELIGRGRAWQEPFYKEPCFWIGTLIYLAAWGLGWYVHDKLKDYC